VFPHVLSLPHILIGSDRPVPWDVPALRLQTSHLELRHYFSAAGIDLPGLLAPFMAAETPVQHFGPGFDRAGITDFNTDVFPRDELSLPALWEE
jgi:hypothetical protein